MLRDGHVHTKYCPHGSRDLFEHYIEKALSLGMKEITFTEHAPLPDGFTDPVPMADSAMKKSDLSSYFTDLTAMKKKYAGIIRINTGLEIDYIDGYEKETAALLEKIGPLLDDSILSVHFLHYEGRYDCIDYSPDVFATMAAAYGSVDAVHEHYYRTVLKSIQSELGPYKPSRIGHITLARKFRLKYPPMRDFTKEIDEVLLAIKAKGYELDFNGAGTAKPLCRETYPPRPIAAKAAALGIPLVYGSDAHRAKELGQGYSDMIFEQ